MAFVLLARGDERQALEQAHAGLSRARVVGDPQVVGPALANVVWIESELDAPHALEHARECLDILANQAFLAGNAVPIALVADRLGVEAEVRALADALPSGFRWVPVLRLLADAAYADAADLLAELDRRPHEAYALLRVAELFGAKGLGSEARLQLDRALSFWRSVAATRFVSRAEALLPP